MNRSDPLELLLKIREQNNFDVDSALIEECYLIQKDHQFDKGRNTIEMMKKLIEECLESNNKGD